MPTSDFLDAAIDVVRESGAVLVDAFGKGVRGEAKDEFDLVSDADRASEALILERLRADFPSHTIVAEEGGTRPGHSSLYRWYVDPLDGTKNFVRGYPAFTLSVALEHAGELVVGVVFDPIRQELFSAERGAGAFCNGDRISVSASSRLEECLVTTGYPSARRHRDGNVQLLCRVSMTTQGLRRTGSSALDLCYVACGRVDAFWDLGLSPWDVAAGAVIVKEAGGRCSDLHGAPFVIGGPSLLAANPFIHASFVRVFTDVLTGEAQC